MPILQDYPSPAERNRFFEAYIAHGRGIQGDKADAIASLEMEIRDWRAASHAFWCAWGVVMSEDDPELVVMNGDEMEDVHEVALRDAILFKIDVRRRVQDCGRCVIRD